jgi:hypothetical protein
MPFTRVRSSGLHNGRSAEARRSLSPIACSLNVVEIWAPYPPVGCAGRGRPPPSCIAVDECRGTGLCRVRRRSAGSSVLASQPRSGC